ncbi:sodium-dependent proline transporter-like isoform X2 [Lineus longissimus]|uniref:sodium-dependent proline transporter-like isoform X2 n=1 Tax=Lineus longissimus TaxID=88925 RepID=UPI00315D8E8B
MKDKQNETSFGSKLPMTRRQSVNVGPVSGTGENQRETWSNQMDFLLSCIGYAVGLGNVWRFPYLCYRNGGGAFLIPYLIMLALAGLPLFFMELCLGQFSHLGALTVWKISPIFKGIGYASVCITWLTCIYYNVIIMYTIFYLFSSFAAEVPWASCDNWWNTENCYIRNKTDSCNGTIACNETEVRNLTGLEVTPSQEYWERYVLQLSDGIDHVGVIRWQLALCLLLSWIIVFACLAKGVKSSGKVVYFTAVFPYVVLVILLIRGVTLDGAIDGIKFYIIPKFSKLADVKVWSDAAQQIFYSLGPAWGGLITMASYNQFKNNCYRDAIVVSVCNCGTSIFAGFVIFSVMGFMAKEMGRPVEELAASGPGLAFIAYPEGISRMPVAPLWAILFFFMLITLGLDSQFTMMETVVAAFVDEYPNKFRPIKTWLTLGLCVVTFLLGLPLVTQGGQYILTLMDWYIGSTALMVVGLLEPIIISYIYGFRRFSCDIEMMLGFKPNYYLLACWTFITPAILLFIIIFSSIYHSPVSYGNYVYPGWADGLGWGLAVLSMQFIPTMMIVTIIQGISTNQLSLRSLFCPPPDWGPCVGSGGLCKEDKQLGSKEDVSKQQEKDSATPMSPPAYQNPAFDPDHA